MKWSNFFKPKDLWTFQYWFHLIILAVIVLGLLQLIFGGSMFTLWNILVSVPLLAVGDVVAHTIMRID